MGKLMLIKLLRSVVLGLVVAVLLLLLVPTLRQQAALPFTSSSEDVAVSYNGAVRRSAPAVVNIYTSSLSDANHRQLVRRTLGSGVIMDQRGYIITNKHVIDGADQIIVALQDGRISEALLVGADELTDLAVLKINANNLPVIPVNPDRIPHVGDVVLAIGNPYNLGQTITQGIISATGRVTLIPSGRHNFLQTDASINRGNSGGALVNSLGELVGINTLSFDKSDGGETPEGLGFAVPAQLATKIMEKLIRDGRVIRGYIGIITSSNSLLVSHKNGSPEAVRGIVVQHVDPGEPAALAGIRANDVILSVKNKPAISVLETMNQVAELRPGTVVPVVVLRNDRKLTFQVIIQEYQNKD